jgi:hypothetical protein
MELGMTKTRDEVVELMADAMYVASKSCEYGALYINMANDAYKALVAAGVISQPPQNKDKQ